VAPEENIQAEELKMQPAIHFESKAGFLPRSNPALRSECIVGCIFNSGGLIITHESPLVFTTVPQIQFHGSGSKPLKTLINQ
jgi:hypothetical protein